MSYYRSGYRRPYRPSSARMVTSVSGDCTPAQRSFVLSLISQIEAGQAHATPEMLSAAEQIIGSLTVLPALLHDTAWQTVSKETVSAVIDSLKVLAATFASVSQKQDYPGLPPYSRLMSTRFNGKCSRCGERTIAGTDLAIQRNGQWSSYCLSCATTDPAQQAASMQAKKDAAAAAKAALAARLAPLAGLHLWDRKVYRIDSDGIVEARRGRRWYEVAGDVAPFSEATIVSAEVASAYADEHGHCINCGEAIGEGESRRSIAVGYGPVCAKRWGWFYPTDAVAESIITQRRLAKLARL